MLFDKPKKSFDIALVEHHCDDGITADNIVQLSCLVKGNEFMPIHIDSDISSSYAYGFVTMEIADKMEDNIDFADNLAEFIINILSDMNNESLDETYEFQGAKVVIARN